MDLEVFDEYRKRVIATGKQYSVSSYGDDRRICYFLLNDKLEVLQEVIGHVCYGHIFYTDFSRCNASFIVDGSMARARYVKTFNKNEEHIRHYWNWLVNESFWSPTFLTKDFDDVCTNGCIVQGVDIPGSQMMQGLQLCRYMFEAKEISTVWNILVEQGVQPTTAIVAATFLFYENEKIVYKEGRYAFSGRHNALNIVSPKMAQAILDGKPRGSMKPFQKAGKFEYSSEFWRYDNRSPIKHFVSPETKNVQVVHKFRGTKEALRLYIADNKDVYIPVDKVKEAVQRWLNDNGLKENG